MSTYLLIGALISTAAFWLCEREGHREPLWRKLLACVILTCIWPVVFLLAFCALIYVCFTEDKP